MSERQHLRARMRTLYAEYSRLMQLRHMTGTGQGIARIPVRRRDGSVVYRIITPGMRVATPIASLFGGPDLHTLYRRAETVRWKITDIPEQSEPLTEVFMSRYWQLANEKRRLEHRLMLEPDNIRRWYPGWYAPVSAGGINGMGRPAVCRLKPEPRPDHSKRQPMYRQVQDYGFVSIITC